jgi:hypothetical protein
MAERESKGPPGPVEIRIETTREQAGKLLELMAEDDSFRDRFEQHPGEVLQEYGIIVSGALPATAKAPPKEEIELVRSKMADFTGEPEEVAGFWGIGLPWIGIMRWCFLSPPQFTPDAAD